MMSRKLCVVKYDMEAQVLHAEIPVDIPSAAMLDVLDVFQEVHHIKQKKDEKTSADTNAVMAVEPAPETNKTNKKRKHEDTDESLRSSSFNDYAIHCCPETLDRHKLYQHVRLDGFDKTSTDFATDPPPAEAVGIGGFVSLFEIYNPARGEEGIGMKDIYNILAERGGGEGNFMTEDVFYISCFKPMLIQKINAFRAREGITGPGGPRHAAPRSGNKRFYGVRLLPA